MDAAQKDRAWLRYKKLREFVKSNQITTTELKRGEERDIQKCMVEMQITNRAGKELKHIGRMLGEPTNLESFRRKI